MKNTIQVFGKKKNSIAVAVIKGPGNGSVRLNGFPLDLIQPELMKIKIFEPFLLCGEEKFKDIDIYIKVQGGGKVSQLYAIRQAIAKGLVLYFEKYIGEFLKLEIKNTLYNYDKALLVADTRVNEPKKPGGKGARAKYQKSYR